MSDCCLKNPDDHLDGDKVVEAVDAGGVGQAEHEGEEAGEEHSAGEKVPGQKQK